MASLFGDPKALKDLTPALHALSVESLRSPRFLALRAVAISKALLDAYKPLESLLTTDVSASRAEALKLTAQGLLSHAHALQAAEASFLAALSAPDQDLFRELLPLAGLHADRLLRAAWPLFGDDSEIKPALHRLQHTRPKESPAEETTWLVSLFRAMWDLAEGRTSLTLDDLEAMDKDGEDLLGVLARLSPPYATERFGLYTRAFTFWDTSACEIAALLSFFLWSKPEDAAKLPFWR